MLLHRGLVTRGAPTLAVTVVPDSGTGELTGLEGELGIEVVEGQHRYRLDCALDAKKR